MRAKPTAGRKGRFGPGRNAILKAQVGRGRRPFNLWSIYSARLNRDVILKSDTELDHHCWCEGDEDVLAYVREPEPIIIYLNGEYCRTQFDARVELRGNRVRLDEIKESEGALDEREQRQRDAQARIAAAAGFDYLRVTRAFLEPYRQLIDNWRAALPFLSACRHLLLDARAQDLIIRIERFGRSSLEQLLADVAADDQSTQIAALLTAMQQGRLRSDLHANPFSAKSVFWRRDDPHA